MLEIKKILVPVDFSNASNEAINDAVIIAKKFGADIHILHAIDLIPLYSYVETSVVSAQLIEEQKSFANERLLELSTKVNVDVPCAYRLECNFMTPSAAIENYVRDHQIDIIVIPRRSKQGIERFLLGSVADKVIRTSACPVLMVPFSPE